MTRFVSEPLLPRPGFFEVNAMRRGEPGLPAGFAWRGREYAIASRLAAGKTTGSRAGGAYVRRHTFRLRMDDGSIWNVYFLRRPPRGASRAARPARWFLQSVEDDRGRQG